MRNLNIALALAVLPVPGLAHSPGVVVAVNAEKASGFVSLADCERALGGNQRESRGSLFNRLAGNQSRCELVQGEYLIVVYPRPREPVTD